MGCESLLGHLVHAVGAYLDLNPVSLLRHERDVQGLVAVGLGVVEPVAQPVGVALVDFRDGDVDVEALVDLLLARTRGEDDAHGEDVVDLLERDVLVLHLVPDGVGGFYTLLDGVLDSHLLQLDLDGHDELVEQFVALGLGRSQLRLDVGKLLGMLEAEAEVLELGLNLIET